MHENFRYQKFPDTRKVPPVKFFGTMIRKISTENRDTRPLPSPPLPSRLLALEFFDIRKYRRAPLRNNSGQKIPTENRDTPRPSYPYNFSMPENF